MCPNANENTGEKYSELEPLALSIWSYVKWNIVKHETVSHLCMRKCCLTIAPLPTHKHHHQSFIPIILGQAHEFYFSIAIILGQILEYVFLLHIYLINTFIHSSSAHPFSWGFNLYKETFLHCRCCWSALHMSELS